MKILFSRDLIANWFGKSCIYICSFIDVYLFLNNCNLFLFVYYFFLFICQSFLALFIRLIVICTCLPAFPGHFYFFTCHFKFKAFKIFRLALPCHSANLPDKVLVCSEGFSGVGNSLEYRMETFCTKQKTSKYFIFFVLFSAI